MPSWVRLVSNPRAGGIGRNARTLPSPIRSPFLHPTVSIVSLAWMWRWIHRFVPCSGDRPIDPSSSSGSRGMRPLGSRSCRGKAGWTFLLRRLVLVSLSWATVPGLVAARRRSDLLLDNLSGWPLGRFLSLVEGWISIGVFVGRGRVSTSVPSRVR
eukprot:scaffold815_cov363-Pavlova_lutheri.AAC.3